MKTLIIAISLLLIGQKGFCQDWVYTGIDAEGSKYYAKSSYVTKEDDNIKIWTKRECKKSIIKKNGKNLTYLNTKELQLIVVDCSEKKLKSITTIVYNAQGKVVDSYTLSDYEQEWVDVVPDSLGESMLDKICQLFN